MTQKKSFPFVVLDETTLTNGVRVLVGGVKTDHFERNPVALYLHNDWSMPIGMWENVRKENGRLLADFVPDYDDPDPGVKRLLGKVERGVIRMASVGLADLSFTDAPEYLLDEKNEAVVIECRLREISIVPIGKNHNALRLYDKNGEEMNLADKTLNLSEYFTNQPKTGTMKKEILTALNLADTATQAQIDEAVEQLLSDRKAQTDKVAELQGGLDAIDAEKKRQRQAEALQLTDAAIKDGRLDAKAKDAILKAFDNDHDGTRLMLESIAKPVSVKEVIGSKAKGLDLADKTWDELDRAHKLEELRANDFALYSQKFEEKFGRKPAEK